MGAIVDRLNKSLPGRFYAKWSADRAGEGAILIAWQALLSLFPLIVGLLSILGYVLRDDEMRESIVATIVTQFPSQVGDLLGFLEETRELGGILGIISLVGLLWSGSNLFGVMASVFNRFYGAPDRSFIHKRLIAFGMILVYAVLITVSVFASGISTFLVGVSEEVLPFQVPGAALVAGWVVSFTSAAAMFLALYRFVPNVPLGFRDIWRGALLATVLVVALNQAFPIYLSFMGGGFAVYKTLGVFFLLTTWLYVLAHVIILGAVLNAVCSRPGDADPRPNSGGRGTEPAGRPPASEKRGVAPTGREPDVGHAVDGVGARVRPVPARSPVDDVAGRCRAGGALSVAGARATGSRDVRHDGPSAWKLVMWAGLTATVAGVTLAVAQRTGAGIWRAATGEAPPR
ncbi:MAG: YihY/virulence factor BrkB family protein [Chloroflexota bacterium]|nr:YihY/virulence factor BrkB family protein [Chloroflexota bacterium]